MADLCVATPTAALPPTGIAPPPMQPGGVWRRWQHGPCGGSQTVLQMLFQPPYCSFGELGGDRGSTTLDLDFQRRWEDFILVRNCNGLRGAPNDQQYAAELSWQACSIPHRARDLVQFLPAGSRSRLIPDELPFPPEAEVRTRRSYRYRSTSPTSGSCRTPSARRLAAASASNPDAFPHQPNVLVNEIMRAEPGGVVQIVRSSGMPGGSWASVGYQAGYRDRN